LIEHLGGQLAHPDSHRREISEQGWIDHHVRRLRLRLVDGILVAVQRTASFLYDLWMLVTLLLVAGRYSNLQHKKA